jgi:4-amino-4-deoxy-L-arabinose transferase-like glycosyltransferase
MIAPRWRCRLIAAFLILGAAILRLLYLANDCPLDLAPDEAHYWDWSRHLDWSYYSKGPLVSWIIRLSCWLFGPISEHFTGSEMLAVRIPAVVFGSLLLVSVHVLTVQVFRREGLALAVVAIGLTMPLLAAGSALMTIDSPYTCCWGWALVVGFRAVVGDRKRQGDTETGRQGDRETQPLPVSLSPGLRVCSSWPWLALGLLVGVGILAKYTMVLFVPFLGLFLLATPAHRHLLRRPGFWIMALVAALCCLPIVIWNWQHDWITLRHAMGHVGMQSERTIHWLGPLRYVGTQFGILLGFWFIVWLRGMWAHRPGHEARPELLYLWWLSAPMFIFFGLFSLKNGGGEPNWPVTAYVSGLVLAAGWIAEQLQSPSPAWRRWTLASTIGFGVLGLLLTVAVHRIIWVQPVLLRIVGHETPERPMPLRKIDPTARLRGWRTPAREVDAIREQLRRQGVEAEIAGGSWTLPGELGFYCAGHPQAYSFGPALGERHSQYDLWRPNPVDDPQEFAGKTFIVVGAPAAALRGAFEIVVPLKKDVTYFEQGEPINRWPVVIGYGYRGFPKVIAPNF